MIAITQNLQKMFPNVDTPYSVAGTTGLPNHPPIFSRTSSQSRPPCYKILKNFSVFTRQVSSQVTRSLLLDLGFHQILPLLITSPSSGVKASLSACVLPHFLCKTSFHSLRRYHGDNRKPAFAQQRGLERQRLKGRSELPERESGSLRESRYILRRIAKFKVIEQPAGTTSCSPLFLVNPVAVEWLPTYVPRVRGESEGVDWD